MFQFYDNYKEMLNLLVLGLDKNPPKFSKDKKRENKS